MNDDFEDLRNLSQLHNETARIERLTHHIQRIRESQDKMEQTMGKLADAVNRLAIIEERQNQDRAAMERAFNAIAEVGRKHDAAMDRVMQAVERVEDRVDELEKAEPMNAQTRRWMIGAVTLLATIFIYSLANLLGLRS